MELGTRAVAQCDNCGAAWEATIVGVTRTNGVVLYPMRCPQCRKDASYARQADEPIRIGKQSSMSVTPNGRPCKLRILGYGYVTCQLGFYWTLVTLSSSGVVLEAYTLGKVSEIPVNRVLSVAKCTALSLEL